MKLDNKNILAEKLMGWKIYANQKRYKKQNGKYGDFCYWNPGTNQAQFKEVIEKWTDEIENGVATIFETRFPEQEELTGRKAFLWISNHMSETIEATLEVIKGDKL